MLSAHDERFDSTINRIGLGEDVSDRIEIIDGTSTSELEATTAVVEDVKSKAKRRKTTRTILIQILAAKMIPKRRMKKNQSGYLLL